eukprot:5526198-Pleurochrysis_carterae.AAC.1
MNQSAVQAASHKVRDESSAHTTESSMTNMLVASHGKSLHSAGCLILTRTSGSVFPHRSVQR